MISGKWCICYAQCIIPFVSNSSPIILKTDNSDRKYKQHFWFKKSVFTEGTPRHWLHLHTCSAAWQLWVPSTPATSQIFCENSIIFGGLPIQPWFLSEITLKHDSQSLSRPVTSGPRGKKWINQIHQLSCDKQGPWEPAQRTTGVLPQRGATEPPTQQEGPLQPLFICLSSCQQEQGSILWLCRVWTVYGPSCKS